MILAYLQKPKLGMRSFFSSISFFCVCLKWRTKLICTHIPNAALVSIHTCILNINTCMYVHFYKDRAPLKIFKSKRRFHLGSFGVLGYTAGMVLNSIY